MIKLGSIPVQEVFNKNFCEMCNPQPVFQILANDKDRVHSVKICSDCLKTLNDWGQISGMERTNESSS